MYDRKVIVTTAAHVVIVTTAARQVLVSLKQVVAVTKVWVVVLACVRLLREHSTLFSS